MYQNTLYQKEKQFSETFDIRTRKADLKGEIHFIGQVTGGLDFETEDGLFCEMAIDCGDGWELIQPGANKGIQTQTAYANSGQMFVWGHPIDLHFSVNSFNGWPKALLKVWRLDRSNKIDACSYGTICFPRSNGFHQIVCETWTPTGENMEMTLGKPNQDLKTPEGNSRVDRSLDWRFQTLAFYMNNQPRLTTLAPLTTDQGEFVRRKQLNSITSGKVVLELEVLMKNFKLLGISGQKNG